MNANWKKMSADHIDYVQDTYFAMWLFSIQVAIHQDAHGRFYILENPYSASSWALEISHSLHSRPGCELLRVDQCMFELTVDHNGEMLSQKGNGFSTNMPRLKTALRWKYVCDGRHQHWVLNDGRSTYASRVYPKKSQQLVAREIRATINNHRQDPNVLKERCSHNFEVDPDELVHNRINGMWNSGVSHNYPNEVGVEDDGHMSDGDEEAADEGVPGQEQGDQAEGEEVRRNEEAASRTIRRVIKVVNKDVSDHQKYIVKQVHGHMGHLPKEEVIRVFKSCNTLHRY